MNIISKDKTPKKLTILTLSSLFASLSMCICCALPAFLLLLGGGPILAYIYSSFPKLILIEKYSLLLFIISGSLIITSGIIKIRNRNHSCPTDTTEKKSCTSLQCFNKYIFSIFLFICGSVYNFFPQFFINNSLLINI
jgi:hypothetical protein